MHFHRNFDDRFHPQYFVGQRRCGSAVSPMSSNMFRFILLAFQNEFCIGETASTYDELPYRLEAGTPNIAGNIGLGAAVRYLESIGIEAISRRESLLLEQIRQKLLDFPQVHLLGAGEMAGCLSFCLDGCSCYDAARLLSELGVAVRSGSHCAQPYLAALGVSGTVRVSPAFYNTEVDLERFFSAMQRVTGLLTKQRPNVRRRGHG